ncbi:hypothetical protein AAG570_004500 [Ranatra chinensis]|uniref:Thioredoxin domain-containing protein n=1 Tax=Ranatra chinensis TaxID=642074 RepID=A0ABD0Y1C7_9HEMI
MVVVFKGVCSSCNALRQNVGSSEEIARLAEGFVMVNVEDPEDSLPELRPVTYVPRVLFFTPDGKFCEQFYNRLGNPKYKFFYPNATSIAATMKDVLEKYPIHPPVKQL